MVELLDEFVEFRGVFRGGDGGIVGGVVVVPSDEGFESLSNPSVVENRIDGKQERCFVVEVEWRWRRRETTGDLHMVIVEFR